MSADKQFRAKLEEKIKIARKLNNKVDEATHKKEIFLKECEKKLKTSKNYNKIMAPPERSKI